MIGIYLLIGFALALLGAWYPGAGGFIDRKAVCAGDILIILGITLWWPIAVPVFFATVMDWEKDFFTWRNDE